VCTSMQEPVQYSEDPEDMRPLIDDELAAKIKALPNPEEAGEDADEAIPSPPIHGTRQANVARDLPQQEKRPLDTYTEEADEEEDLDSIEEDEEDDFTVVVSQKESAHRVRSNAIIFVTMQNNFLCQSQSGMATLSAIDRSLD
jgi:hypothetical protein